MRFSDLTQRIAGDGAAAWDIHYRALAMLEQGNDMLLSVGDPDFDTPQPIVQGAIDSLLAGNTHYADVRGKRACVKPSPGGTGNAAGRRSRPIR
jgi:arginine:pyruvate transaminase